jgi:hypothetical protein
VNNNPNCGMIGVNESCWFEYTQTRGNALDRPSGVWENYVSKFPDRSMPIRTGTWNATVDIGACPGRPSRRTNPVDP